MQPQDNSHTTKKANRWAPERLEAVRELSPILEIVAQHVRLKRAGVQFVGICPFHAEKSPSFSVNPRKQVFYCHGCQAGGDVFTFIQKLTGCSFPLAVQSLAANAGLSFDGFKPGPQLIKMVKASKAQRESEFAFRQFFNQRVDAINCRHRTLARSATHAEKCLRAGEPDSYLHDNAWDALNRFLDFEARIERERLADVDILKAEWEKISAAT
jgi:CHC2 zinc finger